MQGDVEDNATYLGVQRAAGSAEFYNELLDEIAVSILNETEESLSILENPSKPISIRVGPRKLQPRSPSVVLGGGFESPFGRIPNVSNRRYFGVRGYLTLNRLQDNVEANAIVGELAILAPKLQLPPLSTSDILYVHVGSQPPTEALVLQLRRIGASMVSLDQGLNHVVGSIRNSELVVSDGVIGLAIADGFGIPNVWHEVSDNEQTQFQVMDYLLGVERAPHPKLVVIPNAREAIEKKARTAPQEVIEGQSKELLRALNEIARLQTSFVPTAIIDTPIEINDEPLIAPISGGSAQAGKFEFDYVYVGSKSDRQVVVSFDLVSEEDLSNAQISKLGRLPHLYKSPREDIGFYRYLDLEHGSGKTEILFDLPDGLRCRGIKVLRWSDPDAKTEIVSIMHTKFR